MALTRKQGYPALKVDKNGEVLTDCFFGEWSEVFNFSLPAGTKHREKENYVLDSYSIKRNESGTIGEIEITYVPQGIENVGVNTNKPEPSCRVTLFERRLEEHKNYRTKWNYHLAMRDDGGDENPSWWNTATDVSTSDDEKYRWIKEPSELPNESEHKWSIIKRKTKPGQEAFLVPSIIVEEKYYFSDVKKASKACQNAGKIKTPKNTFGRKNGSWLNMGADISREGRKWVVSTSYQFSPERTSGGNDGWDTDLYET